jgi:hypothetical protein
MYKHTFVTFSNISKSFSVGNAFKRCKITFSFGVFKSKKEAKWTIVSLRCCENEFIAVAL